MSDYAVEQSRTDKVPGSCVGEPAAQRDRWAAVSSSLGMLGRTLEQRCGCMRVATVVALAFYLSGCASVESLGGGSYRIRAPIRRSASPFPPAPEAAVRANAFCQKKGQSVQVVEEKTTRTVGWEAQEVELTFKCV